MVIDFGIPYLVADVGGGGGGGGGDGGGDGGGGGGGDGGGGGGGGGDGGGGVPPAGFPVHVTASGTHWRFETTYPRTLDIYPPPDSTLNYYHSDAFCLAHNHDTGFGVPYSGSGPVTGYCLNPSETVIRVYQILD